MPDTVMGPMTGPEYVLESSLITMGTRGEVAGGAVYIDAGSTKAVQSARQASPLRFEKAPRIRTGDTSCPGAVDSPWLRVVRSIAASGGFSCQRALQAEIDRRPIDNGMRGVTKGMISPSHSAGVSHNVV